MWRLLGTRGTLLLLLCQHGLLGTGYRYTGGMRYSGFPVGLCRRYAGKVDTDELLGLGVVGAKELNRLLAFYRHPQLQGTSALLGSVGFSRISLKPKFTIFSADPLYGLAAS